MKDNKKVFPALLAGAFIGFINGFFGGGGGMLVVPVLTKFFNFSPKKAHATSIAVILPITVISVIIYLLKPNLTWQTVLAVGLGVTGGGILGAFILKGANNKVIEYLFVFVMLFAGAKMLFF